MSRFLSTEAACLAPYTPGEQPTDNFITNTYIMIY